jgi:uncharacterized protein (TIGR00369 family)
MLPTLYSIADVDRLVDQHFPEIHFGGRTYFIETLTERGAIIRLKAHPRNLRPGNTISGPALFTLADYGVYVAILSKLGESGLQAVTTNLNLNFLNRAEPGDVIGDVELKKLGKRLIVAEVEMHAPGRADLIAHATATYIRPG